MKMKEIREMAPEDIRRKIEELRMDLLKSRIAAAGGQLGNRWTKRHLRRDIARMLTQLTSLDSKKEKSA